MSRMNEKMTADEFKAELSLLVSKACSAGLGCAIPDELARAIGVWVAAASGNNEFMGDYIELCQEKIETAAFGVTGSATLGEAKAIVEAGRTKAGLTERHPPFSPLGL